MLQKLHRGDNSVVMASITVALEPGNPTEAGRPKDKRTECCFSQFRPSVCLQAFNLDKNV